MAEQKNQGSGSAGVFAFALVTWAIIVGFAAVSLATL